MKEDSVFKALAEPQRRKMLDLIKEEPGINVNTLTKHFEFTRYATLKHLKILEEADLVISKKEWKDRKLYLNAVPIQLIYDRWISQYAGKTAKMLTNLKRNIEGEKK